MAKAKKVTLASIHTSMESWLSAAKAYITATILDQTAPEEGTTPTGKGKSPLTVPGIFVSYGFPSSSPFADVKIAEGVRFAKKRGDLWEPSSATIGRARLTDTPVTAADVVAAEKSNQTIGESVHGARLLDSSGKQSTDWMLFLNPRLGAGMASGEREVVILATMLHYFVLAALGPAEVILYDPKKQPKAFKKAPKGRTERYGQRFKTYANMVGFAQPDKKENFDLRDDITATLRQMVTGGPDFPEPLGSFPAPVVSGFTLKRIGADVRDFPRARGFVCPLYDKKDANNTHTSFMASSKYAPDLIDETTGLVTSVLADFAPVCGKKDCGKVLQVVQPPPLRLYNEAISRKIPVARALLIASGEIPPPWGKADQKDAASVAETPAEMAAAVAV